MRTGTQAAGVRFGVLERYVLGLTLKPMAIALGVVLLGLLLERILRLVDVLAVAGAPVILVFALSANLVPHYLGFAVPAAFALGVFSAFSRMSQGAELESMLASGVSVWRLTRPLVALGALLGLGTIAVTGYIDPHSRYAYREILNSSVAYAWRAHAPAEAFISVRDGLTVTADAVDATGRRLTGVFIEDRAGARETLTTAAAGTLELTPDGKRLQLRLHSGVVLRDTQPGGRPSSLRFTDLVFDKTFALEAPPFRPRGGNERELTLSELWSEMGDPASATPDRKLSSEFHARLARAAALVFLPFLIVPLSMTMRRQSRVANMAVAALSVLAFQNVLQLGETLAHKGAGPAPLLCWGPLVLLAGLSALLYATSTDRPGDTVISRAMDGLSAAGARLVRPFARLFRRRRPLPAG
ncbi:lipopolysaccharide export system permease protein [Methylopila jiangsuensis]|uniref:LptF/LptG family permease n=1 Tax=Methylopila jiangsuensis TaxID=586230 RepID=UPI0022F2EA39|nr:LptF/LptG family permease [Methylopila jiangsuensis]MDR6286626.1 lipopolysaccharide export system permease protein [Methylopila jiangsuensis]